MSDFPQINPVVPTHIGTYSRYTNGPLLRTVLQAGTNPTTQSWPTANLAGFYPLFLPFPYTIQRFWWVNGATGLNADVGVYTPGGVRMASCGSTAQSGANNIQYAAATTVTALNPGWYYLAFTLSNTTVNCAIGLTFSTAIQARTTGVMQMASALPLPATATFAAGGPLVQLCGFTNTASGF